MTSDIETLSVEDTNSREEDNLFEILNSRREGLTDEEVNERIEKFEYSQFVPEKTNPVIKFLLLMWNPITWIMILTASITIVLSHGGGKPTDWEVFIGILFLIIINATINFIQQRKSGNNVDTLTESIEPEGKVKRNNYWKIVKAVELVRGDIINIKSGDVVPADGRLIDINDKILMDQSSLTGQSFPVNRSVGDEILCGAICRQGEGTAIISATGPETFAAKTMMLTNIDYRISHLQTILLRINNFRIFSIVLFIIVELLIMYVGFGYDYRRGINNILALLVGGIPMVMIIVFTIIFVHIPKQLSKYKTIAKYFPSIEELSGVTILCVDKTGTLTLNKIVIEKYSIKKYSDIETNDIIYYAALASNIENQNVIDACIISTYGDINKFNSIDKRTEITYKRINDGSVRRVTKGMPHTILDLCTRFKTNEQIKQFNDDVEEFAQRGFRSIAVAIQDIQDEENGFKLIGLLPIYDPLNSDAKETIDNARQLGKNYLLSFCEIRSDREC
ncbi:unnamed protein product [Rotaria sp. Silwood1]|nr:unnamed protein product [Rotaria sp. Silwood1]